MSRQMRSKAIVTRGSYYQQSKSAASGPHVNMLSLFLLLLGLGLFILFGFSLRRLVLAQSSEHLFEFLFLIVVALPLVALLSRYTTSRGGFGRTGLAFGGRSSG